ncbi:MFS transporter [Actinomadura violacea]|uniref:MFS transporter n=1 Tax=Actinomadura violacea TaxID=2819934 RepID=A0ABS3RK44_9ACTN|nr:MFS transporter [Actinomadura violacea]MBO2456728.1 MFS transporter [Actinomadura violacea]
MSKVSLFGKSFGTLRRFTAKSYRSFRGQSYSNQYFTVLSAGSAVSQLGSMGVAAAGPLLVLSRTESPISAGYVTAASVLPGLVLHLPAGALADRVDRRTVMWTSQVVRIISALATCLYLVSMPFSVPVLILAAFIDGCCAIFYEVAEIATVPELIAKESLAVAIGSNEAKLNASMLLGRPMGGALLAIHPAMPYLVDACTSFLPVGILTALRRPVELGRRSGGQGEAGAGSPAAGDAGPNGTEGAEGRAARVARGTLGRAFGLIAGDVLSRTVIGVCFLANFFFQVIVLLQILLAEREGIPSYVVGLLLSLSGLGGTVGAVLAPFILRKRSPALSVLLCVLAWIPVVWMVAVPANPAIGLVGWGLCSVVGAPINIALKTHQANVVPGELFGLVTGITRFLSVGAVALGALSGGWIIHFLGTGCSAYLIAFVFALIAPLLVWMLRSEFARGEVLVESLIVFASVERVADGVTSFVLRGVLAGLPAQGVAPDSLHLRYSGNGFTSGDLGVGADLIGPVQEAARGEVSEPSAAVEASLQTPVPGTEPPSHVSANSMNGSAAAEVRSFGGAADSHVTGERMRRSTPSPDLVRSVSGDAVSGGFVPS